MATDQLEALRKECEQLLEDLAAIQSGVASIKLTEDELAALQKRAADLQRLVAVYDARTNTRH